MTVQLIPEYVLSVCRLLRDDNFEAWLVGGALRDLLMGREPHDWDIATNARPDDMLALKGEGIEVLPTGLQHGTVTFKLPGGCVEVTTFRGDGDYSDGRRPDNVVFCDSIEEDLSRRDFTVNAMAYDPLTGRWVDPFKGKQDLCYRVLRAVGDPQRRFAEDGLRCMRLARFAATLGFKVDYATLAAIEPNLSVFRMVAPERVQVELWKALQSAVPSQALRIMMDSGMLPLIDPELGEMFGLAQNAYHAYNVWEHTLRVVDSLPPTRPDLRLAALLHDVGKPLSLGTHPTRGTATFYDHEVVGAGIAQRILTNLRFSTDIVNQVTHLVRHHLVMYMPDWSKASVRRWVRRVGEENVADVLALAKADILGKGCAMDVADLVRMDTLAEVVAGLGQIGHLVTKSSQLAINGRDVMETTGLTPGPMVGTILENLLKLVLEEPELNTRETLLKIVAERNLWESRETLWVDERCN